MSSRSRSRYSAPSNELRGAPYRWSNGKGDSLRQGSLKDIIQAPLPLPAHMRRSGSLRVSSILSFPLFRLDHSPSNG